jgi:hypothetical protein
MTTNNSKSIKNILKKLNFLKVTGINKLVLIEVHSTTIKFICIKNKDPFYKLIIGKELINCEVIASEFHEIESDSLSTVHIFLKKFIEKNNLTDAYAVVGINDFKFSTINIPIDTEDIESWFSDNSGKFMPEGRPASDFQYSYEQYYEDENSKYYFIVTVRNDYISKIYKACNVDGLHIINISPFALSLNFSNYLSESDILFLDISSNKISYTIVNLPGVLLNGEYYYQSFNNNEAFDIGSFTNDVELLHESLLSTMNFKSFNTFDVYLSCKTEGYSSIEKTISTVFNSKSINSEFKNRDPFYLGSYLAFNKINNAYDRQINLLSGEIQDKERFLLEKNLSMRIILGIGMILITMLTSSYFFEGFINNKINDEQENLANYNSKTVLLANLKKENGQLTSDISVLKTLREKKIKYSGLLSDLSKVVSDESCLTAINIKDVENGIINMELSGLAESQQEIASIIAQMEKSKSFKNVSLIYSAEKKIDGFRSNNGRGHNFIQFNIAVKYYANKE